jgi:MFS family permease
MRAAATGQADRGLPTSVVWLSLASFFNDVSGEIVTRALPLFLAGTLGTGYHTIGLIEGLADTTSSLLRVYSGWYSDRIRKRKGLAVFGYFLTALARPLLIGTTGWVMPLISRIVDRTGKGIRTAPRDALLAASVSHRSRGRAFGFQRALDPFGAAVGALIAASVLYLTADPASGQAGISRPAFDLLIYTAILPTFVSVLLIALLVKEPPQHATSKHSSGGTFRELLRNRRFKNYMIILFIFTLGSSSDAFLILRANAIGIDPLGIFIVYALLNLLTAFSSYPAGVLSDRVSRRKIILAGWVIYSLIYFGFAFASSPWQAWALFIVYGVFFGLTEGVERALVADLVPEEQRGTAYGLYNGIVGIALLPASLIAGTLWERFGAASPFLFGGSISLIAAVAISRVSFRKETDVTPGVG